MSTWIVRANTVVLVTDLSIITYDNRIAQAVVGALAVSISVVLLIVGRRIMGRKS